MIRNFFISVILVWFSFSLSGCRAVKKHKATTKKTINTYEEWQTVQLSKPEKIIYMPTLPDVKDTIIKKGKLKLKINYTKKGTLKKVTAEKEEDTASITNGKRYINETSKTKENDKEKEPPIKDIWFLYIGLIMLILVIANNKTKILTNG